MGGRGQEGMEKKGEKMVRADTAAAALERFAFQWNGSRVLWTLARGSKGDEQSPVLPVWRSDRMTDKARQRTAKKI